MDSPYWKGPLPGVDVQRRLPVETFRAQAEQHSGGGQKVFGFSPESVFALRPESCSESARNPVRLHPGMLFGLPRNTHSTLIGHEIRNAEALMPGFSCLNGTDGQPNLPQAFCSEKEDGPRTVLRTTVLLDRAKALPPSPH